MQLRLLPILSAALVLVLMLGACGQREEASDRVDPEPLDDEPAPHGMEPSRVDTLHVEGHAEPVSLQLFDAPGSPALIYYPSDDFSPSEVGSGQAFGVHFVATFGGVRNDDAWIRYFFPTPGSRLDDPDALQMLIEEPDGIADIEGFDVEATGGSGQCPGDARAWTIVSQQVTGGICVGSRDDRYFLMIASYPHEYGDGFAPRAEVMRRNSYWRDTLEPIFP
jgi:hypothetical protein